MKKNTEYLLLNFSLLWCLIMPNMVFAIDYSIMQLSDVGWSITAAMGMNNNGLVVGSQYIDSDSYHAFLWDTVEDSAVDLGTLGGQNSRAYAVNNYSQVVGYSTIELGYYRAFIWDDINGMIEIGSIHPYSKDYYYAFDINDSGLVVGVIRPDQGGNYEAFIWDRTNGMMNISNSFGGTTTYPTAINEWGYVTGYASSDSGRLHAFIWDRTNGMVKIDSTEIFIQSKAFDINELGQVVGYGKDSYGGAHIFLWDNTNGLQDLIMLALGSYIHGLSINDHGQIVGCIQGSDGIEIAITMENNKIEYLYEKIPPDGDWDLFYQANAINDYGYIVGTGVTNSKMHAFLLTPDQLSPGPIIHIPNQPPTADAGLDQMVFDEIALDASSSKDPDGIICTFDWQLQHRENSVYNKTAQGMTPTVSNLSPGFYDVILTVTDDAGEFDTDVKLLGAIGLKGDLDLDGVIDGSDLSEFAESFGF